MMNKGEFCAWSYMKVIVSIQIRTSRENFTTSDVEFE
jgi:hypothetical protein